MSITDELRKWAKGSTLSSWTAEHLTAIADRIDAEHERKCTEQYACGAEHGIGVSIDASMIQTHGYVELPKDADGEYVHVGDVMENVICPSVHREVTGVGVECFYGWDEGNGRYSQFDVNRYRHHHAPTVEDVLREFTDAILEWSGKSGTVAEVGTWSDIAADYAAKLRLAEGEDA